MGSGRAGADRSSKVGRVRLWVVRIRFTQGFAHLRGDPHRLRRREAPLSGENAVERLPVQEFHHEVGVSLLRHAEVMHPNRVRLLKM